MKARENEEPCDWYAVATLDGIPDWLLFANGVSSSPLDRYELRYLARFIRRMTGDTMYGGGK